MNNAASILILAFLAISFIQSGYDKLFYWKDNVEWLKGTFCKNATKKPCAFGFIKYFNHGINFGYSMHCRVH